MSLDILHWWTYFEPIQYMFMATIVLGLIKCIKYLMIRR